MIEMIYHLQLNEALGPEMQFLGLTLNAKGVDSLVRCRWRVFVVGVACSSWRAAASAASGARSRKRSRRDARRDASAARPSKAHSWMHAAKADGACRAYAVELRDLRKSFGKTEIIRGTNLAVKPGERVAIIGPNGAGKSTLFNLISGRFGPTSGEILLRWRAHRRQAAVRDQPPRPGAQLPGQQPVHAAVGVRERALRGAVVDGLPLRVLALPRRPERCQRARRASAAR